MIGTGRKRHAHAFPDLVMVGAHMGRPWYEEAISLARGCRNVYLDVQGMSGLPRVRYFKAAYQYRMPGGGRRVAGLKASPDSDERACRRRIARLEYCTRSYLRADSTENRIYPASQQSPRPRRILAYQVGRSARAVDYAQQV